MPGLNRSASDAAAVSAGAVRPIAPAAVNTATQMNTFFIGLFVEALGFSRTVTGHG